MGVESCIWIQLELDVYCTRLFVQRHGGVIGGGPGLLWSCCRILLLVPFAKRKDRMMEFAVEDLDLWSKATSKVPLVMKCIWSNFCIRVGLLKCISKC